MFLIHTTYSNKNNSIFTVESMNKKNSVAATADTAQYWSKQSRIYSEEAKSSADQAELAKNEVVDKKDSIIADIEDARVEAVESVTAIATTGVASVEEKVNTGITNIETTQTSAVNAVNTTKTSALTEINNTKTTAVNAVNTSKTEALNAINQIGVNNLANKDLSNLSATGEARFASGLNNKITNCLLEVPQNIKLELNNGTLTLKAGSKVIVPNGAGVFEEVTITKDLSTTGYHDGKIIVFAQLNSVGGNNIIGITEALVSNCTSGSTNPTNGIYYNISSNTICRYTNSVADLQFALPLAICTRTSGVITSIDQVFNGMGYIGSTVWVDKGVKGLIPNGRNADGSLKNIEFVTDKVKTTTRAGTNNYLYIDKNLHFFNTNVVTYDQNDNYNLSSIGDRYCCEVGFIDGVSGVITSLTPKQPFRAVDYNDALLKSDKSEIVSWGMPDYSAGISVDITTTAKSFTAPCDGLYVTNIYTDGNTFLIINGVSSPFGSTDSGSGIFTDSLTIPLNAGDVIKWDKNLYSSKAFTSVFYPLKGAN